MPPLKKSSQYNRRIVTLGGGTGHFALLRGLVDLNQPEQITALTGTWDSGGSSGRLRVEMGVLPSGDIRQCLLALMESPEQRQVAQRLFNDRLADVEGPLKGHAIGNLIESQLQRLYQGQDRGINAARALFQIRAKIIPISVTNLELLAKTKSGQIIEGEARIDSRGNDPNFDPADQINGIYFDTVADPSPPALKAIKAAELIIFSAGDLFTSILPHLLVKGIPQVIKRSAAKVCLVLNLMTKKGETDFYRATDFLQAFSYYFKDPNRLDYVIVNTGTPDQETLEKYEKWGQELVKFDQVECQKLAPQAKFVLAKLAKYYPEEHLIRHDPKILAETLLKLQ